MAKVIFNPTHLPTIARRSTELIKHADSRLLEFLKLLLTIYTPVSSGLFFLSAKIVSENWLQRISFLIVSTTAVFIVLSSLVVFFTYFLISTAIAKKYVDEVNNTGEDYEKQITGKRWHSKVINVMTFATASLVSLNLLSVLIYIYSKVA